MNPILTNVLVFLVLGVVLGVILTIAAKVFEVPSDARVDAVREALPGANCGACGEVGCDNFALAVVEGKRPVNGCPVGGADSASKIAEIMGTEADVSGKVMVARVRCSGTAQTSTDKYIYDGFADCATAALLHGGPKTCSYGCLGLGSCVKACAFDAISIVDGLAHVDTEACRSCGQCVEACPKDLIEMIPKDSHYTVGCRSTDKGGQVRKYCTTGCIGCTKCVQVCPVNAIEMQGAVAYIDPDKCTNCGKCAEACPTKCILHEA